MIGGTGSPVKSLLPALIRHDVQLTLPECCSDSKQCSSAFLLPFTSGPAAFRASLAEVNASFGVSGSCLTFFPPTLLALVDEAALLFGAIPYLYLNHCRKEKHYASTKHYILKIVLMHLRQVLFTFSGTLANGSGVLIQLSEAWYFQ